MDAVSVAPVAGAQSEFAALLMVKKYFRTRGEKQRREVLIPDAAHGTNPASAAMAGFQVITLPSAPDGLVDTDALKSRLSDRTACLMLTNPNTLGLFEERLEEVTGLVHAAGGLVYGDGANFNALLGICRPGELGIDVMHFNLHKTFSTPHGGGGPGSGAVGVSAELAPYLPAPVVERRPGSDPEYRWAVPAKTIGRVKAFHGNFGILVRAYTYIRSLGPDGLRAVAENAVLNANYLQQRIRGAYPVPHADRRCMHEFVAQGKFDAAPDVRALDVSKRLIDKGFHPPTNYFPLIVPEALMIEPTETESREAIDAFAEAMLEIAREAVSDPALLHDAPHDAPVKRLDEVKAARELKVTAS